MIQLLTPSTEWMDEYNEWLRTIPQIIRQLVFAVKRYYRRDWGENWREHFTVDRVNGVQGHELKYHNQRLVANYLRVGYDPDGSWRIYKLRPDFHPAAKVQVEDDITVSVVRAAGGAERPGPAGSNPQRKIGGQLRGAAVPAAGRRDRAGIRSRRPKPISRRPGTFLSNYEPLTREQVRAMVDHVVVFDRFTAPMQNLLRGF